MPPVTCEAMSRAFISKSREAYGRYGHMLENVTHFSKDKTNDLLEKCRLAVIMQNMENNFRMSYGVPGNVDLLSEAVMNQTGNIASFVKFALPMIQKVYPDLMTRDLVSIQPMNQPDGKLFYTDFQRSTGTSLSTAIDSGKTYADSAEQTDTGTDTIARIKFVITGSTVSAVEKKLLSDWSAENAQDLMAYHGMSIESLVMDALSSEIAREWDRIVLADMKTQATGGSSTFDQTVPDGITYTDRKIWMETLYEKFLDVDNQIYKKRYRRTNYAVVPADVGSFMEKMAGFRVDPTADSSKIISTGGRYFMGTLNNRWRVYVDPIATDSTILMGYNNPTNWLDTSYVVLPYIPLYFSQTFENPRDFISVKAVLSRVAYKCVVPDLLGKITVTGS